ITGYLQSLQLAYNANHELSKSVTITQQGLDLTELTTTYQYDAFGRRISKHTQTKHKTRQVNRSSAKIIKFPVQQQKTKQHHTHYLWDGNRQLQEQTDTHVFTTIYEQDSFEPVARLVWLQDGVSIAANDDPDDEVWTEPKQPASLQVYHFHND
ncbi:hypothetical protein ACTXLK_13270, partial [Psychrobacter faecalis]